MLYLFCNSCITPYYTVLSFPFLCLRPVQGSEYQNGGEARFSFSACQASCTRSSRSNNSETPRILHRLFVLISVQLRHTLLYPQQPFCPYCPPTPSLHRYPKHWSILKLQATSASSSVQSMYRKQRVSADNIELLDMAAVGMPSLPVWSHHS